MTLPILTTKLYIPPVRSQWVLRPRLIEQLDAGLHAACKLTLVSAPAGFGKTTLLSEWIETRGLRSQVAWLSLDKGDNDPAQFWTYVIVALQAIHDELGESVLAELRSPQPPPVESVLTVLVNELADLTIEQPLVLVLDDFHLIENPVIHESLAYWVEHLPPQIRLVVAGRADPPWPLGRLRSRREVAELRANDLRFTAAEVAAFLNDVMRLGLAPQDIAALDARTEGWIAGLQMAALALQGAIAEQTRPPQSELVPGQDDRTAFIRAFSGSHHFVLDYLVEEVLERQSGDIQDFLLKTSLLDRMTASLCDAVTGRHSGQAILTQLDRSNLFLIPLDSERRWYRYHHLFADLLQSRLRQTQSEQVAVLHRRASQWHEENGWITEAVGHALAAGDVERVARLVERNVLAMVERGELSTIARQLDALPGATVSAHPWLCIARAWVSAYAGQLDGNAFLLQAAQDGLSGLSEEEGLRVVGHLAAVRAYAAWIKGEGCRAAELARQALAHLPEQDLTGRALAVTTLGLALQYCDDLSGAAPAFEEAVALGRQAGDLHVTLLAFSCQAFSLMLQGKLHQASVVCQEGLSLAQTAQRVPALGSLEATYSAVLLHWNDLESALHHARAALELAEEWQQADTLHLARTCLTDVLVAIGDLTGALLTLQKAKQSARMVSPWFARISAKQEAELRLAQGDVEAASRAIQAHTLDLEGELDPENLELYITLARILIARARFDEAARLLARIAKVPETTLSVPSLIQVLALQALAQQGRGATDASLSTLRRALALAEPEGFIHVFVEQDAPMRLLMADFRLRIAGQSHGKDEKLISYADRLLAAFAPPVTRPQPKISNLKSAMMEPLSERELQVLRLLNTELSSTDIAEQLCVSTNTVRSHIKSIYGKLNVHGRLEAIQQARKLGVL